MDSPLQGERRVCPEECLPGDWVTTEAVTDWPWKLLPYEHVPDDEQEKEMVFFLRPYVDDEHHFIWQRIA
jgi:hypothetical protein